MISRARSLWKRPPVKRMQKGHLFPLPSSSVASKHPNHQLSGRSDSQKASRRHFPCETSLRTLMTHGGLWACWLPALLCPLGRAREGCCLQPAFLTPPWSMHWAVTLVAGSFLSNSRLLDALDHPVAIPHVSHLISLNSCPKQSARYNWFLLKVTQPSAVLLVVEPWLLVCCPCLAQPCSLVSWVQHVFCLYVYSCVRHDADSSRYKMMWHFHPFPRAVHHLE